MSRAPNARHAAGHRRVSGGGGGAGQVSDNFLDLRLNAGSFQNLAHLHLKAWVERNGYHEAMMANPAYKVRYKA
eukprot:SAG22_NODE_2639_length_2347_cov_2.181940_4_plen_73_part_01